MPIKCETDCPYSDIMNDLKISITELRQDVKELVKVVTEIKLINLEISTVSKDLKELKEYNIKDHDEIFTRMRLMELNNLTKKDMIGIVSVIGVLFTVVSIIINLGSRMIR